ncbi:MAG: hypothetical protein HFJ41_03780 [Clostridia bacterium]|nr:hypothetical protein [Clostridia bacterium]
MEDNTWLKLYRKLLKSPIFENEKALKIWIWCLLKATHIEREQLVGQQIVHLEKGQFIFGRNKASEELKMTESTIYKYIKLLEKLQMISINSNNKFSIVTIEKWEDYQDKKQEDNNKITTEEQQSNTNKNVKNIYYLFNIYKAKISGRSFGEKIKLINECKNSKEYMQLDLEEQNNLFNELMKIK